MSNIIFPTTFDVFPEMDIKNNDDHILDRIKFFNTTMRKARNKAKLKNCYYRKKECTSFCNSHSIPQFCLKNISENGKLLFSNSLIKLPALKKIKGLNDAGTFHLICRDCDSKIFKDYENPNNYQDQPTTKMLAEIDMKNNLRNISKRLIESEIYKNLLNLKMAGASNYSLQDKIDIGEMDLKEYIARFENAKKRALKPFSNDYYIGYYVKLPYTVPLAFQEELALNFDLEGNIINDTHNLNLKYKIMYVSLSVFPLEGQSVVMMFVNKKNERYKRFFKQLNRIENTEEQLSVINYIIFLYSEDFLISPKISKDVLDKITEIFCIGPDLYILKEDESETTQQDMLETKKGPFNLNLHSTIPNLLSQEFSLSKE